MPLARDGCVVTDDKPGGDPGGPWLPPGLKVRSAPREGQKPASPLPHALPSSEPLPGPHQHNGPLFRPLPVLSVLSALSLVILFMLGQWQWTKFLDKRHMPAVPVLAAPIALAAGLEAAQPDFTPVFAEGLFDARTIPVYAVQDGVRGYRLMSPLVMDAGVIFVDRGFVPEQRLAEAPAPMGAARVEGVLRKAARANRYTPDNDPVAGAWYWPDIPVMAEHVVAQDTGGGHYIAMSKVDPLQTGNPVANPWADPKGANQVTADRHFGYALTWWGLALALVGVYAAFHARAGRLRLWGGRGRQE